MDCPRNATRWGDGASERLLLTSQQNLRRAGSGRLGGLREAVEVLLHYTSDGASQW